MMLLLHWKNLVQSLGFGYSVAGTHLTVGRTANEARTRAGHRVEDEARWTRHGVSHVTGIALIELARVIWVRVEVAWVGGRVRTCEHGRCAAHSDHVIVQYIISCYANSILFNLLPRILYVICICS
jgi:hypothetical protein